MSEYQARHAEDTGAAYRIPTDELRAHAAGAATTVKDSEYHALVSTPLPNGRAVTAGIVRGSLNPHHYLVVLERKEYALTRMHGAVDSDRQNAIAGRLQQIEGLKQAVAEGIAISNVQTEQATREAGQMTGVDTSTGAAYTTDEQLIAAEMAGSPEAQASAVRAGIEAVTQVRSRPAGPDPGESLGADPRAVAPGHLADITGVGLGSINGRQVISGRSVATDTELEQLRSQVMNGGGVARRMLEQEYSDAQLRASVTTASLGSDSRLVAPRDIAVRDIVSASGIAVERFEPGEEMRVHVIPLATALDPTAEDALKPELTGVSEDTRKPQKFAGRTTLTIEALTSGPGVLRAHSGLHQVSIAKGIDKAFRATIGADSVSLSTPGVNLTESLKRAYAQIHEDIGIPPSWAMVSGADYHSFTFDPVDPDALGTPVTRVAGLRLYVSSALTAGEVLVFAPSSIRACGRPSIVQLQQAEISNNRTIYVTEKFINFVVWQQGGVVGIGGVGESA